MCDKVVSKEPFILKYCLDRCNTQKVCDKAVDDFLPTLKFVPDWFVKNKMLEKLDDVVFSNDDIVFVNADSDNVTFLRDDMGLVSLVDVNFNDDDTETIIQVRLMAWCNRYKPHKACKKKRDKQIIATCSMASKKMVVLVHVRN